MNRKLPDWIDSYLQYVEKSEPAKIFHTWVAISCIAAALERRSWILWDEPTYPNMYIVLVGPSGSRKGSALRFGRLVIKDLGLKFSADSTSRRALISDLEGSMDTFVNEFGAQVPHCSMTIYSEEFAVFLGFENRQLIVDLCDWFDCRDPWVYKTQHAGVNQLRNVWVNIIGATTPTFLQDTVINSAIGLGLTSRMIFACSNQKEHSNPFPFLIHSDVELLHSLRHDLGQINLISGQYKVTDKFLEFWGKWYPEQEKSSPINDTRFSGYHNRRAKHLLKLSLILSASRSSTKVIEFEDIERGLRILEETEKSMHLALSGVGKSDIASAVSYVLQVLAVEDEVTQSQLMKILYHDVDVDDMKKVIATLITMGKVDYEPVREGKNIIDYRLKLKL